MGKDNLIDERKIDLKIGYCPFRQAACVIACLFHEDHDNFPNGKYTACKLRRALAKVLGE